MSLERKPLEEEVKAIMVKEGHGPDWTPPEGEPWIELDGEWFKVVTDTGDGVPEKLEFGGRPGRHRGRGAEGVGGEGRDIPDVLTPR